MPEGDTIHKLANTMRPRLQGQVIDEAEAGEGPYRRGEVASLVGRRLEAVEALGKNLLMRTAAGPVLWSHLGLHGSWHRYPPGAPWKKPRHEMTLRLRAAGQDWVLFRAKEAWVLRPDEVRRHRALAGLGPDLLAEPDFQAIVSRARQRGAMALGELVLDQSVACGAGNVYKSEVLFLHHLDPFRPANTLSDAELEAMYRELSRLMARNLGPGQRVTTTGPVRRSAPLWVYDRTNLPCFVCGAPINSRRQGPQARMTYWCAGCQR